MPRFRTICTHPAQDEREALLIGGVPNRAIARQRGVSKDAVACHAAEHLPESLLKAQEARDAAQADALLGQVRDLQCRTLSILADTEADRLPDNQTYG